MQEFEKEIINRLKIGDERAYHYLFETHYVLLCKLATEFLKDDFLAETIVGNVIVHLWEKRDSLDVSISLRAYLVRAVRNSCLNYLDQRYVKKEMRFTTSNESVQREYHSFTDDTYPLGILLEKELEYEIAQAIERLPDECRRVFQLSRLENMKNKDIAEKLNISINTVKYHLKNALSRLSTDLGKYLVIGIFCVTSFLI